MRSIFPPLERGKTFSSALPNRAWCKGCVWLSRLLHKKDMHFCLFLLDNSSFLEQSHHTMRKPNNHVKGPPTGVSAKNRSCCHDRKPASAVRHVGEWTCRWVQPPGIKSLPAFRLFQLSWYHAEHRHTVPAESFPNYKFVNKINGHECFKPLSLGCFVT